MPLFLVSVLTGAILQADANIQISRVFGPEIPGRYKHPASLTELSNGDLYLVYYGGSGEHTADSAVYGARLRQGEAHWSKPERITPSPKSPEGNAVVWQAPDGLVWLFSVIRPGATWSTSRIVVRISRDGAKTWQEPTPLTTEAGTMVRAKPIVLADGNYLLPIYRETGNDPERVGPDTTSLFLRYDGKAKRWSESSRIHSRLGNLQPAVAALTDTRLVCYCRRGGDYEPRTDGYLVRSESRDGGRTWSPGSDSSFPNPNAAADFLRLRNGHLLLVYNDSMSRRTPLTVALSTDGDKSYPYRRNLAEGPGDYAYPFAIQTRDGKIHVVYTSDRRSVINHAVFGESALLTEDQSKPQAETTAGWVKYAKNPVLGGKLGTCFDVSVLHEGNRYRMWFSWRPKKSIALTESSDGVQWSEPRIVLGPNAKTDWEKDLNRPVVLKNGDRYQMWYTGQARGRSWIGYATSPDGKSWQRVIAKPVLAAEQAWEKVAVMCPHVLYDDQAGLYRMWYSGGEQNEPNAIGYAASRDGLNWTKYEKNPVFKPDPNNSWEKDRVTGCQVLRWGDWHLMFYIGFRDESHAQIGMARSRDGITDWQRHPANPIIRPGRDQWDHDAVYKPYAIFDGRQWKLWYNGRKGGVEQIGLALHEGEDLGF